MTSMSERVQELARSGSASNTYVGWAEALEIDTVKMRKCCFERFSGETSCGDYLREAWETAVALVALFYLREIRKKPVAVFAPLTPPSGAMVVSRDMIANLDYSFRGNRL